MAVTVVVGSQWGDEGKGKIIDYLSKQADIAVRFHGGNNAGHTVSNNLGTFALHLIPCGIFHKNTTSYITNGTVIDPQALLDEISTIEKAGVVVKNRLFISPRCHLIMPYHKILDKAYEEAKQGSKIGTTGRGIGPVHADKVGYNGIRIYDLLDKDLFKEKLQVQLHVKNKILVALGQKALVEKDLFEQYLVFRKKLLPYIKEPFPLLQEALKKKKNILLEGAQGIFLDNDWGTYPFVTASNAVSGAATQGAGIAPAHITNIIGVAKAYTTRVGEGPFPTELHDSIGEQLRMEGNEFGATTGRPRRCGWFDAELVRFAKELNGYTSIILTKLDILDNFDTIKLCTGYTYKGKAVRYFDGDAQFLGKVTPVYKTFKGWKSKTAGITKYQDLPSQAKVYVAAIEKLVGVKVSHIATGVNRDDIIVVNSK